MNSPQKCFIFFYLKIPMIDKHGIIIIMHIISFQAAAQLNYLLMKLKSSSSCSLSLMNRAQVCKYSTKSLIEHNRALYLFKKYFFKFSCGIEKLLFSRTWLKSKVKHAWFQGLLKRGWVLPCWNKLRLSSDLYVQSSLTR